MTILDRARLDSPPENLPDEQKHDQAVILQGCLRLLSDLEKKLAEYKDLNSDYKGRDHNSAKRKFRVVWKRVTWSQSDVDELRSRIISNVTALNNFVGSLTKYSSSFILLMSKTNKPQERCGSVAPAPGRSRARQKTSSYTQLAELNQLCF